MGRTQNTSRDITMLRFPIWLSVLLVLIFSMSLRFPVRQLALLGKATRLGETSRTKSLRKRAFDKRKRIDQDRGVLHAILALRNRAPPCTLRRLSSILPLVVLRSHKLEPDSFLLLPRACIRTRGQRLLRKNGRIIPSQRRTGVIPSHRGSRVRIINGPVVIRRTVPADVLSCAWTGGGGRGGGFLTMVITNRPLRAGLMRRGGSLELVQILSEGRIAAVGAMVTADNMRAWRTVGSLGMRKMLLGWGYVGRIAGVR